MLRHRIVSLFVLIGIMGFGQALAQADNKLVNSLDNTGARREAMADMGKALRQISLLVNRPDTTGDMLFQADLALMQAEQLPGLFYEETYGPGNEAKPLIWTEWEDFAARIDKLIAALSALGAVIDNEEGKAATRDAVRVVQAECGSCHDIYRLKPNG